MQDIEKEFKPTSWAIDNKVAIYVAVAIISLAGMFTYIKSAEREFSGSCISADLSYPRIYPGAAPTDIENLIYERD
jgi:multidrug efflux pump